MISSTNPFAELYVTESIGTETFAKLFSPILARESQTHALFQPGNIVLTGLQGSGKTALLNLMRPEVMIAYRKARGRLAIARRNIYVRRRGYQPE